MQTKLQKIPFSEVIPKYKNFFFDCGGVIYNGNNDLPEAFKALNKLKELGKNIFFVTNASRHTRKHMFERLTKGGFEPEMDKIYTSSYLTSKFLNLKYPDIKKVYVVGTKALVEELELGNLTCLGSDEDKDKPMNVNLFDEIKVDDEIKAVVAGFDFEINYYKLCYASILVQKGALFLGTNPDNNMKMRDFKMPAAGCMIHSIALAAEKQPHFIGKPNPDVINIACETFGLDLNECLIVGDSLATDITLGKNAGIDSFLVLSGVTSEDKLKSEVEKVGGIVPNYYWDQLEV